MHTPRPAVTGACGGPLDCQRRRALARAAGADGGGAVYILNGSLFSVKNSTFRNNSAAGRERPFDIYLADSITNAVGGLRIATEHNLKFYIHLMEKVRQKIKDDCFEPWAKDFIKRYNNE